MKAIIVIPTYQEAATLPRILDAVLSLGEAFDILVVDDNSPDGTGAIADEFASRYGAVTVMHRPVKLGLGSAYCAAFEAALAAGADLIIEMDADLSHNPTYLPALRDALVTDADVAIGSRYVDAERIADDYELVTNRTVKQQVLLGWQRTCEPPLEEGHIDHIDVEIMVAVEGF